MRNKFLILISVILILFSSFVYAQKIQIQEISYNNSDEAYDFIELFVMDDNGAEINVSGWNLTTYEGDIITLPYITGLRNYVYITIYMGSGINDTNADDNQSTIYLGRTDSILDDGDEVGLYDKLGNLIDFVRYNGGNSGAIPGGWSLGDTGISCSNIDSIQLMGLDIDSSIDWICSEPTPNEPNILDFTVSAFDNLPIRIHNGLRCPCIVEEDVPWDLVSKTFRNVNVTGGAGIDNNTINKFVEYINFSLNLYNKSGFNPPATVNGTLHVSLVNASSAGEPPSTGVAPGWNSIIIYVGFNNITDKWTIEHETIHTIHGRNFTEGNRTYRRWTNMIDRWKEDGLADYWGLRSTMLNFNITQEQAMQEAENIQNYSVSGYLRNTDFNIFNWSSKGSSGWGHYVSAWLFFEYIAETYGSDKTTHIYKVQRNFGDRRTYDAGDISGIDAVRKALREENKSDNFNYTFGNFSRWILKKFKNKINYTMNVTYNCTNITENGTLNPFGLDFERVVIPETITEQNIHFIFNGTKNQSYVINVVGVLYNGSSEDIHQLYFNGSVWFGVSAGTYKEVIIIKGKIDGNKDKEPYKFTVYQEIPSPYCIKNPPPPQYVPEFNIKSIMAAIALIAIIFIFVFWKKKS